MQSHRPSRVPPWGCGCCARFCDALRRRSHRPGDTVEERRVKDIVVPVYFVLSIVFTALVVIDGFVVDSVHDLGTFVNVAGWLGGLLSSMLLSQPPARVSEAVLAAATVGLLLMDWHSAARVNPRVLTTMVGVLDLALVVDCRAGVQNCIIVAILLWITLERGEASARFGLYDAGNFSSTDPAIPRLCDCTHTPCGITVVAGILTGAIWAITLLLDYYITRQFAQSMRKQLALVDAGVRVSETITELIASYAVQEAQVVVDGPEGLQLPPALCRSYRQLLANLEAYRPFLPDWVLMPDSDRPTQLSYSQQSPSPVASGGELTRAPGLGVDTPSVCVIFTDVQSSTQLWELHPVGMAEGLRVHNQLMREVALANEGYEVKTIGDSFMLVFREAGRGVRFGYDAQLRLIDQKWHPDLTKHDLCRSRSTPGGVVVWHGLRVRIGVHYGAVRVEPNPITRRADYFGPTVNCAARVENCLANGGLTGVTEAVIRELGEAGLAQLGEVARHDLGPLQLKGVSRRVPVSILLPACLKPRLEVVPEVRHGRTQRARRVSVMMRVSVHSEHSGISQQSHSSSGSRSPTAGRGETAQGHPPRATPAAGRLWRHMRAGKATCCWLRMKHSSVLEAGLQAVGASSAWSAPSAVGFEAVESQYPAEELLSAAELAADMSEGVVSAVFSAGYIVTWNGLRSCADHFSRPPDFLHAFGPRCERVGWTAGAASSAVRCGTLNGCRHRYPTVTGACVEIACCLAEEAELCGDCALAVGPVCGHFAYAAYASRAQVWHAGTETDRTTLVVWAVDGLGARSRVGSEVSTDDDGKWASLLLTGRESTGSSIGSQSLLLTWVHHDLFLRAAVGDCDSVASLGRLAREYKDDLELQRLQERVDHGTLRCRRVPLSPGLILDFDAPLAIHRASDPILAPFQIPSPILGSIQNEKSAGTVSEVISQEADS
eukprot:TRINITY_DN3834_c0_g1_i1.p1 TRINITY_DN3834_c0_g1~~TRINITY_DN3834_c0_g1_i1.p1  ORF type:complete len:979 (+),score=204.15 TRINITY_DN3834_c0_g1_i1:101-2938(+)